MAGTISIAWGGHRNGQIATTLLASVQGVQGVEYLEKGTLDQFRAMKAAHDKATGRNLRVNAGYRALGSPSDSSKMRTQWAFWKRYQEGWGNLAARPGTSNHGYAKSIDLYDYDVKWLRKNAKLFGFENDVPRETWHWTRTLAATITPVVIEVLERDMALIKDGNDYYAVDIFGGYNLAVEKDAEVTSGEIIAAGRVLYGKEILVTKRERQVILSLANNRANEIRTTIARALPAAGEVKVTGAPTLDQIKTAFKDVLGKVKITNG